MLPGDPIEASSFAAFATATYGSTLGTFGLGSVKANVGKLCPLLVAVHLVAVHLVAVPFSCSTF